MTHSQSGRERTVNQIADNGVQTSRRAMAIGAYAPPVDRTFLCWGGRDMDPQVIEYDHKNGAFSPYKQVGGQGSRDDHHDGPKLILAQNGFLHVFYCRHNRQLWQVTSPNRFSTSGTWEEREVKIDDTSLGATYPMPVVASDGTIYLFYRQTHPRPRHTDDRPIRYLISTDM